MKTRSPARQLARRDASRSSVECLVACNYKLDGLILGRQTTESDDPSQTDGNSARAREIGSSAKFEEGMETSRVGAVR